jgi:transposase
MTRKGYPSDVFDDEWVFVAPYLTLMREEACNGSTPYARCSTACATLCVPVRSGAMMPNDPPPWHTVYLQTQRWLKAGMFEDIVRDYERFWRRWSGCIS